MGESPYAAMFNNPVFFSDPMGDNPPGCEGCPENGNSQWDIYHDKNGKDWQYNEGVWTDNVNYMAEMQARLSRPMATLPVWNESLNATRADIDRKKEEPASPFQSRGAQDDFTFQDQDANDVRVNRVYVNPRVGPSASTYHVSESGNSTTVIGTYPTMKAVDPLLSSLEGNREPKNTKEAVELASYVSYQIMTDPNSAPLAKFGAAIIDQTVSTPEIIFEGKTAAGVPVSTDNRALTAILTFVPAARAAIPAAKALAAVLKTPIKAMKKINPFGLRNGYGLFGENGLKIGNYKVEALYANPSAGPRAGTLFSLKSSKRGGALWRWEYGTIHTTREMKVHSTIRFNFNGVRYGSTAQRTWYPSSLKLRK